MSAQAGSGQSVAAFAHEQGVNAQRLYWWRTKLGLGGSGGSGTGGRAAVGGGMLVPVRLVHYGEAVTEREAEGAGGGGGGGELALVTRGGHEVRVGVGFDEATLVRLVGALDRC